MDEIDVARAAVFQLLKDADFFAKIFDCLVAVARVNLRVHFVNVDDLHSDERMGVLVKTASMLVADSIEILVMSYHLYTRPKVPFPMSSKKVYGGTAELFRSAWRTTVWYMSLASWICFLRSGPPGTSMEVSIFGEDVTGSSGTGGRGLSITGLFKSGTHL